MVGVAQLVEHRIVAPAVVGSIPIAHPTLREAARTGVELISKRADVSLITSRAVSSVGRAADS